MAQEAPMLRLLQGDVGAGKTVVALNAMLIAVEAGKQAALLAPTEILARQHFAQAGYTTQGADGVLTNAAGQRLSFTLTTYRPDMREVDDEAMRRAGNWVDLMRQAIPPEEKLYTWWSYRAKDWEASNRGRRLDHMWVTPDLMAKAVAHRIVQPRRPRQQCQLLFGLRIPHRAQQGR